jgi:hypothetical protein
VPVVLVGAGGGKDDVWHYDAASGAAPAPTS